MDLLDEDKSWELFCQKTLFPYKDHPPQLERVGKEIVNLCKGLALSIVVIGGLLLKSPRTVGFWENVVKNIKSIHANSNEKQKSLDVLSLSYNHLPPYLKPCFLYMGVFDEDSITRVSTISRLWVAEGFIRSDGARVLEEIAEGYLNDLADRNLILVRSRSFTGEIGSCGIHDLLRDLCIKVAEKQEFFQVRGYEKVGNEDGRIICIPRFHDTKIEFPLTRSLLMSFRTNSFVRETECNLLRVLSNAYCITTSPETLYENVNLRYLTYTHCFFDTYDSTWKLPSSVSLMWNLQTLIISPLGGCPLLVAHSGIWEMLQLRHFDFPLIYLPNPMKGQDDRSLENLQRLTSAVNLGLSEGVCKMIPNIKKLGLNYDPELQGYNDSMIECVRNMDRLHKLESLNMETRIWEVDANKAFPTLAFPNSLLKLSMKGVKLGNWEDLRAVGLLPQLQVLNIEDLHVQDYESSWSPAKGEFCSLKLLVIVRCVLYVWEIADRSHFPVLEKLILSGLIRLKEIPSAVGDIPTLELIRVNNCREISLAISAIRIKEYHLETEEEEDDDLRVELWVYTKSEMERLKKMVETGQLTLDRIHLEERIM